MYWEENKDLPKRSASNGSPSREKSGNWANDVSSANGFAVRGGIH